MEKPATPWGRANDEVPPLNDSAKRPTLETISPGPDPPASKRLPHGPAEDTHRDSTLPLPAFARPASLHAGRAFF